MWCNENHFMLKATIGQAKFEGYFIIEFLGTTIAWKSLLLLIFSTQRV